MAKIGYARYAKSVRTDVLEGYFFTTGSELEFHVGLLLESSKLDQPLPSNLLKTDFPLKMAIHNSDAQNATCVRETVKNVLAEFVR